MSETRDLDGVDLSPDRDVTVTRCEYGECAGRFWSPPRHPPAHFNPEPRFGLRSSAFWNREREAHDVADAFIAAHAASLRVMAGDYDGIDDVLRPTQIVWLAVAEARKRFPDNDFPPTPRDDAPPTNDL